MRRRHILCVFVAFVLLLAISAMLGNLLGRTGGIDLSGHDPVVITGKTKEFLAQVKGRITLTYFVSSKDKIPADMKEVEPTMRRLLNSLKAEAPDKIDISILDPDIDQKNGASYASRKAIAPVKLRKVRLDATSEQGVWSALDIAFNDYPNAVIPFISAADVPLMQELIVSNLMMMANPAPAVIGVSAPAEGFTEVPKVLSGIPLITPVRVDFETTAVLPPVLDVFMWIAPRRVDERHLRELERFIDSGRSIVIAGSNFDVICRKDAGSTSCRLERPPYEFATLTRAFGLGVRREVVLHEPEREHVGALPFPLHIAAELTDIKALHGFTIGELHASSVTALEPDPDLLSQSGFDSHVVSTTSAETRLIPDPKDVFGGEALRKTVSVPKQPWVVRLSPKDPWRGSVLIVGTASVFSDAFMKASDNSNNLLLKAAAETFTSRERITRLRIVRPLPQPVPPMSEWSRVVWRACIVGAIPLLLLVFGVRTGRTRMKKPQGVPVRTPVVRAAIGLVGIVIVSAFFETRPITPLDLSTSAATGKGAFIASMLSRMPQSVEAELLISKQRYWPAEHKDTEKEIRTALRGMGIPYRIVRPESLPREERDALVEAGIEPFSIDRVEDDQTVRSQVWAAVRLTTSTVTAEIPRIDPRSVVDLPFLVGAALDRLQHGGAGPVVGFVTDIPRMSGAQAFEEYTQMGSTPPEGSDPFIEARNLLRRYGYTVRALNPKDPTFDQKLDLVVWLQPRAPVDLLPRFGNYLASGGKAFVALQQYKVKQRQYRGAGYDTVYWPEPQTHRFNEYLKLIGIKQLGEKDGGPAEILMDQNQGRLALDTRVYQRSRYREMLKQEVVRPFLIRAVGGGLSHTSPITSRLGALLYVWGNRFTLDQPLLSQLGLHVSPIVQTSARPWRFIWDGGWIPEPALSSPTNEQFLEGPLPLAVSVTGRFPKVMAEAPNSQHLRVVTDGDATSSSGELVLSASSEMFTDANIYLEGYQHDRFLLNSVAYLAFGSDMARLQARPRYPQSFPVTSRALKLSWRFIVVFASPLLLVAYGLLYLSRRRKMRRI